MIDAILTFIYNQILTHMSKKGFPSAADHADAFAGYPDPDI